MKADFSGKYQEIKKFVAEKKLDLQDDSPLCEAISSNLEILQFIDHWLSKSKSVIGADTLTKDLAMIGLKIYKEFVSNDYKEWYRILSELETFYLLSYKLGMDVVGYEQAPSPISKPPDFEIKCGNESVYFEVKFKASQVTQRIPTEFNEFLDKIEEKYGNKYRITLVETQNSEDIKKNPNYLKLFSKYLLHHENKKLVEEEIEGRLNVLDREDRHSSLCIIPIKSGSEAIDIHFSITPKRVTSLKRHWCFRPDEIDDIENWLFTEKDSMTPMIKEAESKGADYLVCFIPFWQHDSNETFYDYITPLFSDLQIIVSNIAISRDLNLRLMSGIILMSQKGSLANDYVIVNNANIAPKIKVWHDIVHCRQ